MTTLGRIIYSTNGPLDNAAFRTWLASLDLRDVSPHYSTGFDAVKALAFYHFTGQSRDNFRARDPDRDIDLMLACPNLERVEISWPSWTLAEGSSNLRRAKSIEELRTEVRLDRLLGLRNIKQFTLLMSRSSACPEAAPAFASMKTWLLASFSDAETGATVDVIARTLP